MLALDGDKVRWLLKVVFIVEFTLIDSIFLFVLVGMVLAFLNNRMFLIRFVSVCVMCALIFLWAQLLVVNEVKR